MTAKSETSFFGTWNFDALGRLRGSNLLFFSSASHTARIRVHHLPGREHAHRLDCTSSALSYAKAEQR